MKTREGICEEKMLEWCRLDFAFLSVVSPPRSLLASLEAFRRRVKDHVIDDLTFEQYLTLLHDEQSRRCTASSM